MSEEKNRNIVEIYKSMVEIEQKKSSIYSNLWTLLITGLTAIFGFYITNPNENYFYLFLIPAIIGIWAGFALFNVLYLSTVRRYIGKLEENIEIEFKEGKSIFWYKDIFQNVIRKKTMPFLISIVSLYLLGILSYVYVILYQKMHSQVLVFILGSAVIYLAIVVFYLLIQNRIDNMKWNGK